VFDRDEASVGNPLAAPLPDENPVATSDNTGAVDASGAEILKMMQAAEGSYDSFHPQLTRVPQVPKSDQQIGTLHNLHRPAQSSAIMATRLRPQWDLGRKETMTRVPVKHPMACRSVQ